MQRAQTEEKEDRCKKYLRIFWGYTRQSKEKHHQGYEVFTAHPRRGPPPRTRPPPQRYKNGYEYVMKNNKVNVHLRRILVLLVLSNQILHVGLRLSELEG